MNDRLRDLCATLIVAVLSFLACRGLCQAVYVSTGAFSFQQMDPSVTWWMISAVVGATLGAMFYRIKKGAVSLLAIRCCFVMYALMLLGVILLKSVGIQDISLNLLDLIEQLRMSPSVVLLNVMMFVPLGIALRALAWSFPKTLILSAGFVLALEVIQYVFSLGIADIVDFVLNVAGVSLGYLLFDLACDMGLMWECGAGRVRFRLRERSFFKEGARALTSTQRACFVVSAIAVCLLTIGGSCLIADESADAGKVSLSKTKSSVLGEMRLASAPYEGEAQLRECVIRGEVGSTEWISKLGEERFEVEGTVSQFEAWLSEAGAHCFGLSLGVPEVVGGVKVVHGLPIIAGDFTTFAVDGKNATWEQFESSALPVVFDYNIRAVISIQDGWFRAEELELVLRERSEGENLASFNYNEYDTLLKSSFELDKSRWIDISDGQTYDFYGIASLITETISREKYLTVKAPDELYGVPIIHSVDIYFEGDTPPLKAQWGEPERFVIKIEGNRLTLVE